MAPTLAAAQTPELKVALRLRTGGALDGVVLDYNDSGIVILSGETPYVFPWGELEGENAFETRARLLIRQRGDVNRLSAEDHFQLGLFSFRQERNDLAAIEFRRCKAIDPSYESKIAQAVKDFKRDRRSIGLDAPDDDDAEPEPDEPDSAKPVAPKPATPLATGSAARNKEKVEEAYRTFGQKVQDVLGKRIVLIESPHFLIWTDWEPKYRSRLTAWCEAMYAALCRQFHLSDADQLFPARCPVFCFRSKAKFQQFARYFDGYDAADAVGYTRSIEQNGHVHVVALRQGSSPLDLDRFAATLVHEGTHAFLHHLHSNRLIPHWVNEGLAEMTAERVLGDRCPAGETSALLARQFAKHEWPVTKMLRSVEPIAVSEYPVAQNIVAYLDGLGPDRLTAFVADLKAGKSIAEGLAGRFDGLTVEQLDRRWRQAVIAKDPTAAPPPSAAQPTEPPTDAKPQP